jgi:hypothetical protein
LNDHWITRVRHAGVAVALRLLKETEMAVHMDTDGRSNLSAPYVDRRLIGAGVALMTGGMLMCLTGATIGTVAVVGACRRYLAGLDEPPRETARRRWGQARSATSAGIGAWQDYERQARPAVR